MERAPRVFQISGIKTRADKRRLVYGLLKLGGKYTGGSGYQQDTTHLIVSRFSQSEKILAACAAGIWVLTPAYVLDSLKRGSWLPEDPYEVAVPWDFPASHHPSRRWRERVAGGSLPGAFHGWRVLLVVADPLRRAMFRRIIKAGKAKVFLPPPPAHVAITHVIVEPLLTSVLQGLTAPCYPVTHLIRHLFGSHRVDVGSTADEDKQAPEEVPEEVPEDVPEEEPEDVPEEEPEAVPEEEPEAEEAAVDFSELEKELKTYIIHREEKPRLLFHEFLGCNDRDSRNAEPVEVDFSNVRTMIECGLFSDALDTIRDFLCPGLLPRATDLVSLLERALQGKASAVYLRNLQQVLHSLLQDNPSWLYPNTVKKYFTKLLQCPQCKGGLWPFIETMISYCMSSDTTCHALPRPAPPSLRHLHSDLLALALKFLQGELHSITAGDSGLVEGAGVSSGVSAGLPASGFLLYETFWTVWERSTLVSRTMKLLVKLLVRVWLWEHQAEETETEMQARQELRLGEMLLDMLSTAVEFWCQQHLKLNRALVETGLVDLAEHVAVCSGSSLDTSPDVVVQLVARIPSSRLRLVTADAVFRNLCCRNRLAAGGEWLSLKKMVSSYLPALERLVEGPRWARNGEPCPATEPVPHSWTRPEMHSGIQSCSINETSPGTEHVPNALNRVNAAGETRLHRACKRNRVEMVHKMLSLPGTDINAKDHVGWTPMHEACNHGSTACVQALLGHRPAPNLENAVNGVSPLVDALQNGHTDIAKMLLAHAGSALLWHVDSTGRTPLDLAATPAERAELLQSAQAGDDAAALVRGPLLLPLLEAGCGLMVHLLVAYLHERGPPRHHAEPPGPALARALERHPLRTVTRGWTHRCAVRLAEDAEVLLRGLGPDRVPPLIRESEGENSRFLVELLTRLQAQEGDLGLQPDHSVLVAL